MKQIILATESPFKRALFDRLDLSYSTSTPDLDETPRPGEQAHVLAQRLAKAKAISASKACNNTLVIGCDQAPATENGRILSKPGTKEQAVIELESLSGKTVAFHTSVAVLACNEVAGQEAITTHTDVTYVTYKKINKKQIERYLEKEAAWRCAGAVQSEALGITLLSKIETLDPTALIGLPLIGLTGLLEQAGINLP